jgi:hypothetical protein
MAYANSLYWRDHRAVDMKVWTDLCSVNTLAVYSAASAAHVDKVYHFAHNRWDKSTIYPQRLGKLCEFPTLSTALLLLFFSIFFITKIVVGKDRL